MIKRELNPFRYGKLVDNEFFIDRDKDRSILKNLLVSGTNVILMSPRRWGKSSLVKQSMIEILKEYSDIKVCFIDAFSVHSTSEFYGIFSKEVIKSTSSTWKNWVTSAKKYFKSIKPVISLGADPMSDFSLSFDFDENVPAETSEVLELPEKIAEDKQIRVIVCIDEFQSLARLSDYPVLEDMMRSIWQKQPYVSYCLYGSQRHMMEDIFNSPQKPFFKFGQSMYLNKIAESEWIPFIVNGFNRTKKTISEELATRIAQTVRNHSWYVQQYASCVWNFTPKGKSVTENSLDDAMEWMIETNLPNFQNLYGVLTGSQVGLLKAIAKGEKQLSSAEVIKKYNLGSSASVAKNKKILLNNDYIASVGECFEFVDPVFEIWFRQYSF